MKNKIKLSEGINQICSLEVSGKKEFPSWLIGNEYIYVIINVSVEKKWKVL